MLSRRGIGAALASFALLCSTHAHAHFKLLQPASWLKEDDLGGPQKGSPCGPGNTRPFIGDDVQPIPASGQVTTFHAGESVMVQLQETVYHPGYFRISLAETRAADATEQDFPNPALTDTENCHYDQAAVQTSPHDNVLADGIFMDEDQSGTGRSLMQEVKLPDKPCDNCTLQIVQVMEGHPASSCFYFHCADIKIVAAAAPAAGSGGNGSGGQAAGSAGSGAASAPPARSDDGGCTVAQLGARSALAPGWWALGAAAAFFVRRRRQRAS